MAIFRYCAMLLLLFSGNLFAATRTVTSSGNGTGAGTLRGEILASSNGDVIVFDPSVTLITLSGSDIDITTGITITGNGANATTISGGGTVGIFNITANAQVVINDLSLINGRGGVPSWINGGYTFQGGGAIFYDANSSLTINDCEFSNNNSSAGNGITSFDYGGAVFLTGFGTVNIHNCTFESNSISGGAGISGGAIHTFESPTVFVSNCTFFNNTSPNEGGGIVMDSYPAGSSPSLSVTNCTFFNSNASGSSNFGADIHALGNGKTMTLQNNVFDRSTLSPLKSVAWFGSGTQLSRGGNIYWDIPGFTLVAGDATSQGMGGAGLAGALANNGGTTRTMAISGLASLALDHGVTGFLAPPTDQRGISRSGIPDAGSFEFACVEDQTVSAAQTTVCNNGSTTINLGSTQIGVNYYLRNDANDAVVTGPVPGTGSGIALNTGTLTSTTTFNVYGSSAADSANCNAEMATLVTVTVLPPLTGSVTTTICNEGSVVVNGTTYDAGNPTGTEVFTNVGPNGCDSTVTINLNVLPALTGSVTTTICNEGSVVVNGTVYNAGNPTGTEVFTNVGPNGCDSTVTINLNVLPALTGSVTTTICNEGSVVVNGTTYDAGNPTGTEVFTNVGPNGCDSTVTINLNVLPALTGSVTTTICNEGSVVVNGTTYDAGNPTGTEVFTNVGPNGCDSTVTVNLNVLPAKTGSETSTICNEGSVVVNGTTYNAGNPTGTEVFTNIGPFGCDSTVTINLNVLPAKSGSETSTICNEGSIVVNGTTYNAGNPTGTEVFTNVGPFGCDSTVTINLNVLPALTGSVTSTICHGDSVVVNGTTYNASNPTGTEVFTNVGTNGCDSTVTINLTVQNAIDTSVTQASNTLTSNEAGATYQWIDCGNGNVAISGATNQSYTATANGDYAVVVTVNGCTDTSACHTVTGVGIWESNFASALQVYPNPTRGNFTIDLGATYSRVSISITDISGRLISSAEYRQHQVLNFSLNEPAGVYLLVVEDLTRGQAGKRAVMRLVKQD